MSRLSDEECSLLYPNPFPSVNSYLNFDFPYGLATFHCSTFPTQLDHRFLGMSRLSDVECHLLYLNLFPSVSSYLNFDFPYGLATFHCSTFPTQLDHRDGLSNIHIRSCVPITIWMFLISVAYRDKARRALLAWIQIITASIYQRPFIINNCILFLPAYRYMLKCVILHLKFNCIICFENGILFSNIK